MGGVGGRWPVIATVPVIITALMHTAVLVSSTDFVNVSACDHTVLLSTTLPVSEKVFWSGAGLLHASVWERQGALRVVLEIITKLVSSRVPVRMAVPLITAAPVSTMALWST